MKEVQAPKEYDSGEDPVIFLAGSIEMGTAEKWQDKVVKSLIDHHCLVLNPRRDDFDASMRQEITNPYFNEQVNWELDGLEAADIIVYYFDPATKSPITLMELGMYASSYDRTLIVCCPEGFWRKGNVDIVCDRYGLTQVDNLSELITELKIVLG